MGLTVDTRAFEKSIRKLAAVADRSDASLITSMGRIAVRSINFNTPRKTGTLRAGWRPAWLGLQMNGQPSSRPLGPSRKGDAIAAGTFTDNRRSLSPSISFENNTVAVKGTKTYRYGRRLNFDPASKHKGFLDRGTDEAARKIARKADREYRKLIRRANRG